MNQDVQIGWWTAQIPQVEYYDRIYSTMGGIVQRAAPLHVVDCCAQPDWPHLTSGSTAAELADRKQRALDRLLEHLRG